MPVGDEEGQSHFSYRDMASQWQASIFEDWIFGRKKERNVVCSPLRGLAGGLGEKLC